MKIDYLREFVLLAKNLNYTTTANELFISQSVLSRHIAFVEEKIGATLIERNAQPIRLTEAGKFFKEQCEWILSAFDRTCAETLLRGQGVNGMLKIGTLYYTSSPNLSTLQRILKDELCELEVMFLSTNPDQCLNALRRSEIDAALIYRMRYPDSDQYEFQDLYREPFVAFVNEGNPLAQKENLKLADLEGQIIYGVQGTFRQTVWDTLKTLCNEAGFEPVRSQKEFSQTESALVSLQHQKEGVVVSGVGMSCIRFEHVKCLRIDDANCFRHVSLMYKRGKMDRNIAVFLDFLRTHAESLGWDCDNGMI